MKRFLWLSRHELSREQAEELHGLGFESLRREDLSLPTEEAELEKDLDSFGLQAGDGLGFVAPPVITVRLCRAAERRGIGVFLPEGRPDPSLRKEERVEIPEEATAFAEDLVRRLPSSLRKEGESTLVVLGQSPFRHIRFMRV